MAQLRRSKRGRGKGWTGYILSFFFAVFLALLGYSYLSYLVAERPQRSGTLSRKASPVETSTEGLPQPPAPKSERRPRIVLVIDDLGRENHRSNELLYLDFPLTFSILPLIPYSKSLAIEAHRKGKEVILHLPMEPHDYPKVKPGEGSLLEEMSKERLLWQLSRDIESVPNLKGVSNHMGSRLMEDPEKLKIIFSELKRRGLYFLDSRTTPNTVGLQTAKIIGLKAMERTLFIDNSSDEDEIKKELGKLIQVSLSKGMAIGIGHPHPATIKAIQGMIPKMKEKGIEIVPLSAAINGI